MENNSQLLKQKIIKYSKEIGVDALGLLKAEPFFPDQSRLNYSEEKGYLSSFINKKIEKDFLKEYKTILCVLVAYPNPLFDSPNFFDLRVEQSSFGKVSSSSWGLDYHKVLTDLLEKMVEYIKTISSLKKSQITVDINPFSEREMAAKAGLGWIGKNSNLINQELGSFVFIGEVYLDIDLPTNEEGVIEDLCGSCTLCIENCPVKAIDSENRVINTNLCLSQQTQEKEITNNFIKNKIKETKYVFGCDICQKVCPWNNKERNFNPLFKPVLNEVYIDLNKLSLESNKSFKNKYGHLSGSWRGKKTWQRNGKIILTDFDF